MNMNITYPDIPEENQDLLGMANTCKGIAEFIKHCETPMTIAIQGDWGTGKSTCMKLIEKQLDEKAPKLWFNTWQFSVLESNSKLIVSLMSMLLTKLQDIRQSLGETLSGEEQVRFDQSASKSSAIVRTIGGYVGKFTKSYLKSLGLAGITLDAFYEFVESLNTDKENAYDRSEKMDDAGTVVKLKDMISEQISVLTGENKPFDRIYIFIDDLDRLEPVIAVELMEGIKNFIDCKGCVFVLAVDNEVVERGLQAKYGREKYGIEFDSEKARKSFDKIIQVPFRLPVNTYDITNYVGHFLQSSGSADKAEQYAALISGFDETNPRTIKRSFNLIRLQEKIDEASEGSKPDQEEELQRYALMLFKLESEQLYEKLLVGIVKLCRTGDANAQYDKTKLLEYLTDVIDGEMPLEGISVNGLEMRRIIAVMKAFFVYTDGSFSDPEQKGADAFIRIIQKTAPEINAELVDNLPAAAALKRIHEKLWQSGEITFKPVEPGSSLNASQLAAWIHDNGWLSFTVSRNRKELLMVKANSGKPTLNITFYCSQSPEEIFGEYAARFRDKNAWQSASAEQKYSYYDNSHADKKPRITLSNLREPAEDTTIMSIINAFLGTH